MQMCMVDIDGRLLEILQEDREPIEGEYKVPLDGYYECLNEQRYNDAVYKHDLKMWVGVGEQRPLPGPSEIDVLKAELEKAKEDNLTSLKAIAELYEIVLGGGV